MGMREVKCGSCHDAPAYRNEARSELRSLPALMIFTLAIWTMKTPPSERELNSNYSYDEDDIFGVDSILTTKVTTL